MKAQGRKMTSQPFPHTVRKSVMSDQGVMLVAMGPHFQYFVYKYKYVSLRIRNVFEVQENPEPTLHIVTE